MTTSNNDKLVEREALLQRCFGMDILTSRRLARQLEADEAFVAMFNEARTGQSNVGMRPPKDAPQFFYGKFYTMDNGELRLGGAWDLIRSRVNQAMASELALMVRDILRYLCEVNGQAEFAAIRARFGTKAQNALQQLQGFGLLQRSTASGQTFYGLYPETVPLINELLASNELQVPESVTLNSEAAREELQEINGMEDEFNGYMRDLIDNRLDEVVATGKEFSIDFIGGYIQKMFGRSLYFDMLLALAQQYSLADVMIVNPLGRPAAQTGFNLALFGAPGTGKTFAIDDLVRGDERKGVKAHGLPGRNRNCGGMTPARFIRMGEAYQNKRFNFIVTEFNDWFKYKGMVEPLKLALEQRPMRWETKTEQVGPYRFNSFFATNYNTITREQGYKVTIGDPNFNAIEDRMLCRLHRMTVDRYGDLARSQQDLMLGRIAFADAERVRDNLALVYAIETEHELVKDRFRKKSVMLTPDHVDVIVRAREEVLKAIASENVPFSLRLERRALQLASAMSLPGYFQSDGEYIQISRQAMEFAVKFFVEETAIRANEVFDPREIIANIDLDPELVEPTVAEEALALAE